MDCIPVARVRQASGVIKRQQAEVKQLVIREESQVDGTITSEFCGGNGCMVIKWLNNGVLLMDSKDPTAKEMYFTKREWLAFEAGVRSGDITMPKTD